MFSRWSLDLSADGSTLALGTGRESQDANGNSDIQVLKWNGTHYTTFLIRLPAGETSAVSLSRDGQALGVGLPFNGKNGGTTIVYKFRPPECDGSSKLLRFSITTDEKPHESRWTIQVGPSITTQGSPNHDAPFTTYVEELCVPSNACIRVRVFDSAGDGMDSPSGYSLMIDGIEVASGGTFEFGEIKHIGDCDCPARQSLLSIVAVFPSGNSNNPPMEWALSYQNRTSAGDYVWNGAMGNDVEIFEECIPEGCWHLTNPQCFPADFWSYGVFPSWFYNVTYKGCSKICTEQFGFCPEDIAFGKCLPGETATVQYPQGTYSPMSSGPPTYQRTFPPTSSPYPTYSRTSSHLTSSPKPTENWAAIMQYHTHSPTSSSCWPTPIPTSHAPSMD